MTVLWLFILLGLEDHADHVNSNPSQNQRRPVIFIVGFEHFVSFPGREKETLSPAYHLLPLHNFLLMHNGFYCTIS